MIRSTCQARLRQNRSKADGLRSPPSASALPNALEDYMNRFTLRLMLGLSLGLAFSLLASGQEMKPAARSTPAFDQIKTLAGNWEGKSKEGKPVRLIYSVVSNGSAVMEHLMPGGEAEMITMYPLDGDRIMVTHYCAMGNQPTMETGSLSGATGKYDFAFVRVAGTKTPDEGHMAALSLAIPDKDHLTQAWTFDDHGQTHVETFSFTRVN
jgi:hypothetical protein